MRKICLGQIFKNLFNASLFFNSDLTDDEEEAVATEPTGGILYGDDSEEESEGGKADLFRILRIIRLIRVVRILRFSRYNKNLQTLGRSLMKSGREIRYVLA